jgi:hypothetical protein
MVATLTGPDPKVTAGPRRAWIRNEEMWLMRNSRNKITACSYFNLRNAARVRHNSFSLAEAFPAQGPVKLKMTPADKPSRLGFPFFGYAAWRCERIVRISVVPHCAQLWVMSSRSPDAAP